MRRAGLGVAISTVMACLFPAANLGWGAGTAQASLQERRSCPAEAIGLSTKIKRPFAETSCRIWDIWPNRKSYSYAGVYSVNIVEDGTLTVILSSSSFDSFLYLRKPQVNGREIILNDDNSAGGLNAKISTSVTPGNLRVVASQTEPRSGEYVLEVSFKPNKPQNRVSQARGGPAGQAANVTKPCPEERIVVPAYIADLKLRECDQPDGYSQRRYCFEGRSGEAVVIEAAMKDARDPSVELWDAGGDLVARDMERIIYTLGNAGRHCIFVSARSEGGLASSTLKVSRQGGERQAEAEPAVPPAVKPSAPPACADQLLALPAEIPDIKLRECARPDGYSVRRYCFTGRRAETVIIQAEMRGANEPAVEVRDPEGYLAARGTERIVYTLRTEGRHCVAVSAWLAGEPALSRLSVVYQPKAPEARVPPEAKPSVPSPCPETNIPFPVQIEDSYLGSCTQADGYSVRKYCFAGSAGQSIEIQAEMKDAADTSLELRNPAGDLVATGATRVTQTLKTGGRHCVSLRSRRAGERFSTVLGLYPAATAPTPGPKSTVKPAAGAGCLEETLALPVEIADMNLGGCERADGYSGRRYCFAGNGGQTILIEANIPQAIDPWVELRDPEGRLLAGHPRQITYTLKGTGRHCISVNVRSTGRLGPARLAVRRQAEAQPLSSKPSLEPRATPACPVESIMLPAQIADMRLRTCDQPDGYSVRRYCFAGGRGETVVIQAAMKDAVDPSVELWDPDGYLVARDMQQFSYTLRAPGRHCILVNARSKGNLTPATLSVRRAQGQGPRLMNDSLRRSGESVPTAQMPEATPADPGQKAKALLRRVREAMGGAALDQVKDYTTIANLTIAMTPSEFVIKIESTVNLSGKLLNKLSTPMGEISQGYNGQTAWVRTPQGAQVMSASQNRDLETSLFRDTIALLQNIENPAYTVQALSPTEVDGRAVEGVEVSDPARKLQVRLWLDPKTNLLVKKSYESALQGAPAETEEVYSDYRKTGDLRLPFKTVLNRGGKKFGQQAVTEIRINPGVRESAYTKPN